MMIGNEASNLFLEKAAAKHFVCLGFRARITVGLEGNVQAIFASCFVVEIEGRWLLVTAGHVISDIRKGLAGGAIYSDFELHDGLTGHSFPKFGIPITVDADQWLVIDGNRDGQHRCECPGADYAAYELCNLTVLALQAGGILPIKESMLSPLQSKEFPHWLLAGIRTETHAFSDGRHTIGFTLLPLEPTEVPEFADQSTIEHRIFAKIKNHPTLDAVDAARLDIAGMSGGPIFGVQANDGTGSLTYSLIGIQSGWYKRSRIIYFCEFNRFFAALKATMMTS